MYPHLLRTLSRLQQHHVHANLRRSHGHLIARFLTLPRLHLATPVQTLASVVYLAAKICLTLLLSVITCMSIILSALSGREKIIDSRGWLAVLCTDSIFSFFFLDGCKVDYATPL